MVEKSTKNRCYEFSEKEEGDHHCQAQQIVPEHGSGSILASDGRHSAETMHKLRDKTITRDSKEDHTYLGTLYLCSGRLQRTAMHHASGVIHAIRKLCVISR